MRLVDRTKAEGSTSGVLELFHAGAWGTFCEESRFTTETQFPEVRLKHVYAASPMHAVSVPCDLSDCIEISPPTVSTGAQFLQRVCTGV